MKIAVVMPNAWPKENSPLSHQRVLVNGLQALGHQVVELRNGQSIYADHVACWGWRRGKRLKAMGHEVLVMERGYIGDRFHYTSLGWNGLNGNAEFPEHEDDGGKRFKEHGGKMKPWNADGDYILILGQVKGDASLDGRDLRDWYAEMASAAEKAHGLPVYFRPHPEAQRRGGFFGVDGIKNIGGTLDESIAGAKFTVAYNSNSCLDSVLAGKPCFAGNSGTMAWDMCMRDIAKIETPDRSSAHRVAWTQWAPSEIESGEALVELIKMKS